MDILAIDTETTGLEWWAEDYAFLATTSDFKADTAYTEDEFDALHDRMDRADEWVFHNAAFDLHFLWQAGMDLDWRLESHPIHDTSLLSRIVLKAEDVNYQYGLKHLSTLLLGDDSAEYEVAVKRVMKDLGLIQRVDQKSSPPGAYLRVYEENPEALVAYALRDTRLTYELHHVLMEKSTAADQKGYSLELEVLPYIVRMEHHGIHVDAEKVAALLEEYTHRQAEAHSRLAQHTNREDFNPDSNDQVAEVLIAAGVPLEQLTDTGQVRVDKWALERFEGHPAVDALLDLRTASKFLATYIEPMSTTPVVHPSIWQIGARSHRMSCSKPNMQNIPVRTGPEVRGVLVPGDGYSFVVADYSSIELRVLAYFMNDPEFTALIEEGTFFEYMGETIYKTPDQDKWAVSRSNLKNGTYAIIYGAGGPRIATTIGGGMTPSEGRALATKIKMVLGPAYEALNARAKYAVKTRGYVHILGGRRLYVPRDKDYTALNYVIQGSAAVVMKLGLVAAGKALEPIEGAELLLPVHDELLVRARDEDAANVRELVVEAMESATDGLIPLKVNAVVCPNNYGEAK